MTLQEFPALNVEEISVENDELHVRGHFSHLAGVHLGSSALYCGDAQWPGDLVECDRDTSKAVFIAPLWVQRERIAVGSVVPWLPGGWQFFHVNVIMAPLSNWRPVRFVPSDAQHFRLGDARGWTKLGSTLDAGAVPTHIESAGWDHEHCLICEGHIGRGGSPEGYVTSQDEWLCPTCYERYAVPRDLGFVFGA